MSRLTTKHTSIAFVFAIVLAAAGQSASAQSSSLYVTQPQQPAQQATRATAATATTTATPATTVEPVARGAQRTQHQLSPAIAEASFAAVEVPEPRRFAKQDLITIVIRESTETDFEATLETKKKSGVDGEISDFPHLTLRDLLNLQVRPGNMDQGAPKVGIDFKNNFSGDGQYSRHESLTGRITARVLEVKPNGMLVLEARKHIKADDESLDLVVTGTCRPEDVTIDNTILSTQLYDLRLDKQHEGELDRSTKKGLLTKLFDTLFNF